MDENGGWVEGSSAELMISPNCPRCGSFNTKFCYYNNYSLTQPRYFCKGCRRYWTKGGNLRNVPVGGGCRKNRRSTTKSSSLRFHSSTTQLLSHISSNNNNSTTPDLLASSDSATASHIDLAVVYANFLNNPESTHHKVISKSAGSGDDNMTVGVLEDYSSIVPNTIIHHQQPPGNNNSIGFFGGWDSLSHLFADSSCDHLKVIADESISNNRVDNVNTGAYFEFPGEEEITMEAEAVTWSDSGQHHHHLLLDHDHSLQAPNELLPIMINGPPQNNNQACAAAAADEDSHDHLNLIGTNNTSKDFDFVDHNTFLSN